MQTWLLECVIYNTLGAAVSKYSAPIKTFPNIRTPG